MLKERENEKINLTDFSYEDRFVYIFVDTGARLNIKYCLTTIGIPMLKMRRSHDRLVFNMGIPIPRKDGLYIETGPGALKKMHLKISSAKWRIFS